MFKVKKSVCVLIVLAMVLLTACGSGTAPESKGSSNEASTPSGEASTPKNEFLAADKPITLTSHVHWSNKYVMDQSTMPILQKAGEMTNVNLENKASIMETNSVQAFNLMIASKQLPDIIGGLKDDINKYGMEGAFKPLNDLIEKHAPNFKAYFDKNPDVKYAITAADGNIYQLPFAYDVEISEGWFIRQDWLDVLGLKAPTTVDEMHDVLTAFVNNDPNKNGTKDEVGLFSRTSYDNKLMSMLSIFGVSDYWHINTETNKIEIGSYTPEYKDAMKGVSQWYAEGLIDSQVLTRDRNKVRDELFAQNNGGLVHDWFPSTSSYNDKMQDKVPGFELKAILPVADVNGDVWEVDSRGKLTGEGWGISATNKYPVETMKYFDFWWSETGRRLMVYGIEGEDYDLVDGKPIYKDSVLKGSLPVNQYMRQRGGQHEMASWLGDSSYEQQMMADAGKEGIRLYLKEGVVGKKFPKLPSIPYTEEELKVITSKWPVCRSYILEKQATWLTAGSSKIDAEFDQYMKELKAMGMDEIIGAYNSAYERYLDFLKTLK